MSTPLFIACDSARQPIKAFYDSERARAFATATFHGSHVYEVSLEDALLEAATALPPQPTVTINLTFAA